MFGQGWRYHSYNIVLKILSYVSHLLYEPVKSNGPYRLIMVAYGGLGDHLIMLEAARMAPTSANISIFANKKFQGFLDILRAESQHDSKVDLNYYKNKLDLVKQLFFSNDKSSQIYINFYENLYTLFLSLLTWQRNVFVNPRAEYSAQPKLSKFERTLSLLLKTDEGLKRGVPNVIKDARENFLNSIQWHKLRSRLPGQLVVSFEKTGSWPAGRLSYSALERVLLSASERGYVTDIVGADLQSRDQVSRTIEKVKTRVNGQFYNHIGQTSPAALVEILQKADIVFTVDSGVAHLARCLRKPLLTVFTFSDANEFSWFPEECNVSSVVTHCAPCIPSRTRRCDVNRQFKCEFSMECDSEIDEIDLFGKLDLFLDKQKQMEK